MRTGAGAYLKKMVKIDKVGSQATQRRECGGESIENLKGRRDERRKGGVRGGIKKS